MTITKFDEAMTRGSGFTSRINSMEIQINYHDPLRASSFIKLPKYLADKHAIINVKNNDDKCFMWSVLCAIENIRRGVGQPISHPERISNYEPFKRQLKFRGIDFPVSVKDINKFEKLNSNISINVYTFDNNSKTVNVLRCTNNIKTYHIHLLLLTKQCNETRKSHYCWIKDLAKLITCQVSKAKVKTFFCDRCLNFFYHQEKLEKHKIYCVQQNECAIEMPIGNAANVEFKNIGNQVPTPFIVYADIETLLIKNEENFSINGSTITQQRHEPYSVGYYMKCIYYSSTLKKN